VLDCVEPGLNARQVAGPDFAYHEHIFRSVGALAICVVDALDPVFGEIEAEVLHSVQSESIHANIVDHPLTPPRCIFTDIEIRIVNIGAHEVIVVAVLLVNVLSPAFAWSTS
jgi:hypothetical protein